MALYSLFNYDTGVQHVAPEPDQPKADEVKELKKEKRAAPPMDAAQPMVTVAGVGVMAVPEPEAQPEEPRVQTPSAKRDAENVRVSAFLTPQSLASFPGAVLAVKIIWGLMITLWPVMQDATWVPAALAFGLGLGIAWYSLSDPNLNYTKRQRGWAWLVGVINACFLAATVVGFDPTAITGQPG